MLTLTRAINKRLILTIQASFSHKNSLINATPAEYAEQRVSLKDNIWRTPDPTHLKSQETHLSNGEYLVHKTPVIYSKREVVRCLGGTQIGPGHPQVYIQLNTRSGQPVACKYCGLKYSYKH